MGVDRTCDEADSGVAKPLSALRTFGVCGVRIPVGKPTGTGLSPLRGWRQAKVRPAIRAQQSGPSDPGPAIQAQRADSTSAGGLARRIATT